MARRGTTAAREWGRWVVGVVLAVGWGLGGEAWGQFGGNASYGQDGKRARAVQNERAKRMLSREELPPSEGVMFIEANVMMNVKPDTYVAVFGITGEDATVAGAQAAIERTLGVFVSGLREAGVAESEITVDFTAQTKLYGFEVEPGEGGAATRARERLRGFEIKKTVSVVFREKSKLDALLAAAGRAEIHDLIRVDSLVADPSRIQKALAELGAEVLREKAERFERTLGIGIVGVPQVYVERASTYYPADMYDSYEAGEGDALVPPPAREGMPGPIVERLRRSRTFYYNPLTADGFDRVLDPVVTEPVVQFTLYVKAKVRIDDPEHGNGHENGDGSNPAAEAGDEGGEER